jgi:glycosyltransferase involved in cell wall biosynthesis
MKISLIHPSRGRAKKAHETFLEWMKKAPMGSGVEYVLSVDSSDPELEKYKGWGCDCIYVFDNNSVVEATNIAAKKATGDILLYLSDDFKCPNNWAQLIIEQFQGVTTPMLLKVDDCLQNFGVRVLTIPIMNRQLYEKLGYFWHPGYKSMFVDEDLYNTAEKLRALKFAPQLKFPHEHVCDGKAPDDETYRRSSANWNQGQEFFKQRKAAGFPL